MGEPEKRESSRVPLEIPVKCLPVSSDILSFDSVELWTHDIHPSGTGLNWLITGKPQTCSVCNSLVQDLNCLKSQCPYRAMRDVLMDCGWLQIQGLNHIPGWEKEEKVLGKVMWFKMDDEGINFKFGVQFSRQRPPVGAAASDEIASPAQPAEQPVSEPAVQAPPPAVAVAEPPAENNFVHALDIERWNAALKAGEKQALVVDEDHFESRAVFACIRQMGFTGKAVSSGLVSLLSHFADNPRIVFFNPVFGGNVKMDILENIKRACPKIKVVILVEPSYKNDVLDHPNFRLADFIFIKPLDLERIKDALSQS